MGPTWKAGSSAEDSFHGLYRVPGARQRPARGTARVESGPHPPTFGSAAVTVEAGHRRRVKGGAGYHPRAKIEGMIVTTPAMPVAGEGGGGPVAGDAKKAKPGFSGAAGNGC